MLLHVTFFFSSIAIAKIDQTTSLQTDLRITEKLNQSLTDDSENIFEYYHLDKKNFYTTASLFYGSIGDGGISGSSIVETYSSSGQYNNYIGRAAPGFGFQINVGYKITPDAAKSLFLTYSTLNTSGKINTAVSTGGLLFNDLTQLGNVDIKGFYLFSGPATMNSKIKFKFEAIDLLLNRPWDEIGYKFIKFTKTFGIKFARINKDLSSYYIGSVQQSFASNTFVPAVDAVSYSARFYGLGPQIGAGAIIQLTERIKIKGGGLGAFLAGTANSNLLETATASNPVEVGIPNGGTKQVSSYSDSQVHGIQAWTPVFFGVDSSIIVDLIKTPGQDFLVSLEGGDRYRIYFTNFFKW